ncbi:SprT family protein [Virgibacillus byunsanensis]|uniref:SprT family protein n=1 Tax=Virgibacillus byunsanensis TaxID=570945 RepID=A0ABW3LKL7_9BACI
MNLLNNEELFTIVNEVSVKYFYKPFKHDVRYNNRLRTTGGRYIPAKKLIELNPKYMIEMDENEYIGIIKHELVHYHLHIEGKGYKHGDQDFKQLLKKTGSPRHCKPLPSTKKEYKHTYTCNNCGYVYKRKRRVDIKKFRCGKCGGKLLLGSNIKC